MKIELSKNFVSKLSKIVAYIAKDSPNRAKTFKTELIKELKIIPSFPLSYRKSIFFLTQTIFGILFLKVTLFLSRFIQKKKLFSSLELLNIITDSIKISK